MCKRFRLQLWQEAILSKKIYGTGKVKWRNKKYILLININILLIHLKDSKDK